MKENFPFVSIIIPCFNEEKYIGKCLSSLLEQDCPKEKTEVLVVDGDSKDKTREISRKIQNCEIKIKIRFWIIRRNLPPLL